MRLACVTKRQGLWLAGLAIAVGLVIPRQSFAQG
jgi:hypothetical protein